MPHSSGYVGQGWGYAWMEGDEGEMEQPERPAVITQVDRERAQRLLNMNLLSYEGLQRAYRELSALFYATERERVAALQSVRAERSTSPREELTAQLVEAAGELVRSVIYEDPTASRAGAEGNALYCSGCNRYGIVGRPIEHAASCVAGKVSTLVSRLRGEVLSLYLARAIQDEEFLDEQVPYTITDRERILAAMRSCRIPAPQPKPEPPKKYLPWQYAGGPNECKHGYAEGIPCPQCEGQTAPEPKPEPHIEYEVEEHPWASEEGNAPPVRVTHEEAARRSSTVTTAVGLA